MIYEVTTIAGDSQFYEVVCVSSMKFANGAPGVSMKTLESAGKSYDSKAFHAHHVFSLTGLEEVIRTDPARVNATHDGERFTHAELAKPERLRLIYDIFPMGASLPILRVCPVKGERIFIAEYNLEKAQLPLKQMTFSNEFEGSLDMCFPGLQVFLHFRNFEKENEQYYGRNLRKTCKIK